MLGLHSALKITLHRNHSNASEERETLLWTYIHTHTFGECGESEKVKLELHPLELSLVCRQIGGQFPAIAQVVQDIVEILGGSVWWREERLRSGRALQRYIERIALEKRAQSWPILQYGSKTRPAHQC